jgi:hypothetical protein
MVHTEQQTKPGVVVPTCNHEFKASLAYIARPCLKKNKKQKTVSK